jgi:hypothetical protein
MSNRILRKCLYRLGPLCAAVLIFAPSAFAGPNMVANPGFESGSLAPYWSWGGSYGAYTHTTPYVHNAGGWSAQIGRSDGPSSGDSVISTWVAVPPGNATLTFALRSHCTFGGDFFQVQIRDMNGSLRGTAVNRCVNTGGNFSTSSTDPTLSTNLGQLGLAGQPAQLSFVVHATGWSADPTFAFLDDVSVSSS